MTETNHIFADGSSVNCSMAIGIFNATTGEEISVKLRSRGSNNTAEWLAVKMAVQRYANNGLHRLVIYSDSQLVVNQLNGKFKVSRQFQHCCSEVKALSASFEFVKFVKISRAQNKIANNIAQRCNGVKHPH